MFNLFKRRPDPKGTATIMLYTAIVPCDMAEEDKTIIRQIQAKMNIYANRMREYEKSRQPPPTDSGNGTSIQWGYMTLNQVTANWDMDTNNISLWASGAGSFRWEGHLNQFLANNIIPQYEAITL